MSINNNNCSRRSLLLRPGHAMVRQWKEREKQIERVVTSTVGMYGEMSGILGVTLPAIPALELDAGLLGSDADRA